MAETPEGARLTELHRQLQIRLSSQAMAATRLLWSSLNPASGSAALTRWLTQQVALSGLFDQRSAAMAAEYIQKFRIAEGFPAGPVVAVQDFSREQARESLDYNGSSKVKFLVEHGVAPAAALSQVAPNLMAASQRLALGGGRRVLDQSALANPESIGWRRVSRGGACSFCAMLISRGPEYRDEKSAGEGRHWHKRCSCSVEEVFSSWTPSREEKGYLDSYNDARRSLAAEGKATDTSSILGAMRQGGGFTDSPKPQISS